MEEKWFYSAPRWSLILGNDSYSKQHFLDKIIAFLLPPYLCLTCIEYLKNGAIAVVEERILWNGSSGFDNTSSPTLTHKIFACIKILLTFDQVKNRWAGHFLFMSVQRFNFAKDSLNARQ